MVKDTPKWKLVEYVVKLIEQAISPHSKVEHNVWLPDLTEASNKRQCDIVIWTGSPPRETITIVEVQNRNKPFDINTFDGLCRKMRKVGAQHLICVSKKDFPSSIINEAKKQGPTVRLVLLKEIEKGNWPIFIIDNSVHLYERKIQSLDGIRLGVGKGLIPEGNNSQQNLLDKIFRIDGEQEILSLNDLINIYLDQYEEELAPNKNHSLNMHFPFSGQKLWWEKDDSKVEIIALDFVANIEIIKTKVPLNCSSYHQSDDDTLAWIMDATFTSGDVEYEVKVTLVPTDEGDFRAKIWNLPKSMTADFIQVSDQ